MSPRRRDQVLLTVGALGFLWTVLTAGPVSLAIVSGLLMLGAPVLRLWALGPGTGGTTPTHGSVPQVPSPPSPMSSGGASGTGEP
jgi:hypothetical protein